MSRDRDEALFLAFRSKPGKDALIALLRAHQERIFNICFQVLRHSQDAQDASQEIHLEVTRGIARLMDPRAFKTWLYRVALHVALKHKKAKARHSELLRDKAALPTSGPESLSEEERATVMDALELLDDKSRSLLMEYYFEKTTLEELGRRNGVSAVAMWKRIERAREKLRRLLLGAGYVATSVGVREALGATVPSPTSIGLINEAVISKALVGGTTVAITQSAVVGVLMCGVFIVAPQEPPVTVTTTNEFRRGNNEGLISMAQDRITRDRITAGPVGTWSASTALPSARESNPIEVHNGFIYSLGGFVGGGGSGRTSEVLVAPLNGDGSVGAWSTTTALPTVRAAHSSAAYNGFIYVMGGDDGANWLANVSFASINPNGSLGSWSATTSLPTVRQGIKSFAFNGYLYAIAGGAGTAISEVLVASINADGSLGEWSATTPLPSARFTHSAVVYNGFVYVIGGQAGGFRFSEVLFAPLNSNGTVGAWTATTALQFVRSNHTSIVYNGFIYVIAGIEDNNGVFVSDSVQVAPLNADGTVGTWTATTALPSGRWVHSSVAYNGFIYTMGGEFGDLLSDVVVAAINADSGNVNQTPSRLRGFYSHLVDLQSDMPYHSIILNGQLSAGGVIRLQVRVAPDSTGIFGTETVVNSVTLGNSIQVSGTGRYVWIRISLDDTATTNANSPTYVSDFTVTAVDTPTAGVVFDGPGADVDTQTSTTIEANWSGFTAGAGDSIDFYEWAIGTAPGLTNVQNWTSVGTATSATNPSLNLSTGMKFVSVRATTVAGLTSAVATSDGVQVIPPPSPPSGGGNDEKKGRCGWGASAASGSPLALLGGIALMAAMLLRRRARRR